MAYEKLLKFQNKSYFTVSELTSEIKNILEDEFFDIWVIGEVSNVSTPLSGHSYFTLKDKNASIRCVLFKYQKQLLNISIKNGEEILIRGKISVYEPRGEYQIIVDYVEPYGKGKLILEIEKLKKKLEAEGLFDKKYKKPIPIFPSKVVVITSKTGAAIKDILNILNRRSAGIEILIYPVIVQGENAANSVIEGIKFVNKEIKDCDVIIIARGGGSFEDLMPFNDEKLAYSIFQSKTPIISAIGHETDFTIADFVADVRAPTPSAAAEMVTKTREELVVHIDNLSNRLISQINLILKKYENRINSLDKALYQYFFKLKKLKIRIDEINAKLKSLIEKKIINYKNLLQNKKIELTYQNPFEKIKNYKEKISYLNKQLSKNFINYYNKKNEKLNFLIKSLNNLSPLNILERGYSITIKDGKIIKDVKDVKTGDIIYTRIARGKIKSKVIAKSNSIHKRIS